MVTSSCLPHAPTAPLAVLDAYLAPLQLTEHPNKNCAIIAQVVPDTSGQSLQGPLTTIRWEQDALNAQRVQRLLALPSEGGAVLIVDAIGLPKQGNDLRQQPGTVF